MPDPRVQPEQDEKYHVPDRWGVRQIVAPPLSALWETAYGRVLLLKLAGVLGMVWLGAINRYRGPSALRDWAQRSPSSRHTPSGGERFLRIARRKETTGAPGSGSR